MTAIRQHPFLARQRTRMTDVMWIAVALAALAALSYILMKIGWLGIGSVQMAPEEAVIIDVAVGGYLLGGALILLRRRWLWIIGALINGVVLFFFFNIYAQQTDVLISTGGLISKTLQISLEAALLYLIVMGGHRRTRE